MPNIFWIIYYIARKVQFACTLQCAYTLNYIHCRSSLDQSCCSNIPKYVHCNYAVIFKLYVTTLSFPCPHVSLKIIKFPIALILISTSYTSDFGPYQEVGYRCDGDEEKLVNCQPVEAFSRGTEHYIGLRCSVS